MAKLVLKQTVKAHGPLVEITGFLYLPFSSILPLVTYLIKVFSSCLIRHHLRPVVQGLLQWLP